MWSFFCIYSCALMCIVHGAIEPKILLPFHGNYQVNYTIDADEGCYQWKSLREEVATVTPIISTYNEIGACSRSAVIVVTNSQPIRKTTLVLATNIKTGTIYQSDVIVDKIHVIDIISRTRELYLADPPEELKIRALDQEGNTFSSTAGMEFQWSLAQDEVSLKDGENQHPPVSAHSILHIQKFLDTIYVADPYVDALEEKGKMSDTILISGIQTGAAVVVADLISTVECHKSVKESSVRFVVRDKVMLNPAHEIYLMRHTLIQYKVERWREGIPTEISMPCLQYVLNVRDISADGGAVIDLDQQTSMVVARHCGHSQVYLVDQHLKHYDSSLMEQATSDVYVVEPAYLRFDIEPYHKWILEVGKVYEITVQVYSEDNKRITLDENVRLEGSLNGNYLEVLDSAKNGSWYLVRAVAKGSCVITSSLKGVVDADKKVVQVGLFNSGGESLVKFENPMFTSQNVEIFSKIVVDPPIVMFPWQPEHFKFKYTFKASGGSGNYTWSLNETEASSVSYTGQVTAACGKEEGYGPRAINVEAVDIRNSYHFGNAAVLLAPPAKLQFALSRLEAEIGTAMNLYVGMYAKISGSFMPFTDCSGLQNLQWSIHDSSIFKFVSEAESVSEKEVDPVPKSPFCLLRRVHALKEGHTTVSLSYRLNGETLQASTVIAVFEPLKVIDPVNIAVVALGSAKTILFEGGPNPWPLVPSSHEKTIKAKVGRVEFVSKLSGKQYAYIAFCTHLEEIEVLFTVGNKPCGTNPYPQKAQVSVRISCTVPTSVKLMTEYLPPSCPLSQNQDIQTVVLAGDTMNVVVTVYDKFGNQFDNFTSLSHRWHLDFPASITQRNVVSSFVPDLFQQTKHAMTHELNVPDTIGRADLRLECENYESFVKKSVCQPYNCKISPVIKSSIILDIVAPVVLSPQTVVMFNRPNYNAVIEIKGGSGHFAHTLKTEVSSRNIVSSEVTDARDRTIVVTPLSSGHTALMVKDQCISKATTVPHAQPQSSITVSDLSSLVLKASSLLEVGSVGKVSIQLDMKELSAPDSFDINIKLSSEPEDIISIDQATKGHDMIFYANIDALKVGTCNIKATTTSRDGKLITSNTVKITVFPPLMLKPPRITVIRGSQFYLYTEGGPPEDVQIYLDVEDTSVASSLSGDFLEAHHVGNTTVKVRAITKDGQIFHGKSDSLVHVVQIKGVLIDVPTHRFYSGATVPVHVYGYAGPGYDPVNLDSEAAGLVFSWHVNNHAVLGLQSVHSSAGVELAETLKFTMLLQGRSPGRGSVSVSVSATKPELEQLCDPKLEAEIQVNVFDPLVVVNDKKKVWGSLNNLLLTPETSYYLLTNRDHVAAKVDYSVLCESCVLNITTRDDETCILVNDEVKSVTTGSNPCGGTILVTAHERFGVSQSLVIHVRVKMVSYLLSEVQEKFYHRNPDQQLTGFPLGSKISMKVSQFDNFGQRFDGTKPDASLRSNRNDLIEITTSPDIGVFRINGVKTGVTVFRAWSEKNNVYYFPYPVVSTIEDETRILTVPAGVKKCFLSDAISAEGKPGKWSSNRPFSVVVEDGAVMSLMKTSAVVSYSLDAMQAKMSVASRIFTAMFDGSLIPFEITNAVSTYLVPIQISEYPHDTCPGLETEMNDFAKDTFNCSGFLVNTVEPIKVFNVRAVFAPSLNSYACAIEKLELSTKAIRKISTFEDISFTLSLSVNAKVADRGVSLQNAVNFRFLPAFAVINDSSVIMTDGKARLCVSATLEIHSSIEVITDVRNLVVDPPGGYDDGVICHDLYYDLGDEVAARHTVKFISTLTKQEESVEIIVRWPRAGALPSTHVEKQSCIEPVHSDTWLAYQYYSYSFYTMLVVTILIILSSSLFFFLLLKWTSTSSTTQSHSSPTSAVPPPRRSPSMVHYSPSNSYLFSRSSPTPQRGSPSSQSGGSPSPRRPQLWSSYYQPQGAGT